jgi:hypothetical protein
MIPSNNPTRPSKFALLVAGFLALNSACRKAGADIIYETATLGPTGITGNGFGIYTNQFLGTRFFVSTTFTTSRIGGHLYSGSNNHIFGALVSLGYSTDFPNSMNLSTPDVLGTALLTCPNLSAEVSAPLSVQLAPGYYSLVFGTGLFGATGGGGAPSNNIDIDSPSLFFSNGENWIEGQFSGVRFFVEGVAENVLGDYNNNDFVDAADYTIWRDTRGQIAPGLAADGNIDGFVNEADLGIWKQQFGESLGSGTRTELSIPEPTSLLLIAIALLPGWAGTASRSRFLAWTCRAHSVRRRC